MGRRPNHTFRSQVDVKVKVTCLTEWPHRLHRPWNSPGQNPGVGSLSLLQGGPPTQGSNQGLLPCRQILYQLSHHGSPRILEWVAFPFSRGSSRLRSNPGLPLCRQILYQLSYKEGVLFIVSVPIFHYFALQGHLSGEDNSNPLWYPCLENPMDRGAWRAAVHGGHKESDTNLATAQHSRYLCNE